MNKLLLNNRDKSITEEEFIKLWNNSGVTLTALHKTLQLLNKEISSVKQDDFDCPNHYAKLAYNLGKLKMIETITNMLPDSAKM
jgi:hypothetical protein